MQSRETLKRHAALVDHMAGTQGLDLEELILRGKLTISELDDAVLRCTGCTQPGSCENWLAAMAAAPENDAPPPAYCRNTSLFAELAGG
ncbi:DUF6455 family protein [Sagittula stellata]|nr:DUF6455 family protein [Sagittula stellata]